MKICTKCKVSKPECDFRKDLRNKSGLRSQCRQCDGQYQKNHNYKPSSDKKRIYDQKYYSTHKKEKSNRDKIYNRIRWNKKRANGGSFTKEEWYELCSLYGNICLRCKSANNPLTIDHIIPIKLGGSNSIDNIQPLCQKCNSAKGAKIIDYRTGEKQDILI